MTLAKQSLLAALAIALLCGPVAAQTIYKWTDEQGVVHYADAVPEGVKYERLNIAAGTSRNTRVAAAEASAQEEGETAAVAAPPTATPAIESAQCLQAQANLDTLRNNPVVRKDTDGDGVPEDISGNELQKEIERAQKLVDAYCY